MLITCRERCSRLDLVRTAAGQSGTTGRWRELWAWTPPCICARSSLPLTLLLLRYDIALRPDAPVRVEFFLGLLPLPCSLATANVLGEGERPAPSLFSARARWRWMGQPKPFWLALGVIVLASFAMRMHGLAAFST